MNIFKKMKEKNEEKKQAEIQAMADLITTKAEYRKADREIDKLDRKIEEGRFGKLDKVRALDHIDKLGKAMKIVKDKGFEWQFIPDLDLFTPIEFIELAYKRIKTIEEKERLEKEYPNSCYSLDVEYASDDLEEKPEGFTKYKSLMKKLYDENDTETRVKIIDKWVEKNGENDDFIIYSGNDYIISILKSAGIPRPGIFVEKGYNTIEKCLGLSVEEVKQWKGVGDKILDQFIILKEKQ